MVVLWETRAMMLFPASIFDDPRFRGELWTHHVCFCVYWDRFLSFAGHCPDAIKGMIDCVVRETSIFDDL